MEKLKGKKKETKKMCRYFALWLTSRISGGKKCLCVLISFCAVKELVICGINGLFLCCCFIFDSKKDFGS